MAWVIFVLFFLLGLGLVVSERGVPPCSPPENITFGLSDWIPGVDVARYACFQGYHLVGNPRVECRYGRWFGESPTCQAVLCPSQLPHAFFPHAKLPPNSKHYRYGSEATLLCEDGYEIPNGVKAKIHCRSDGTWEGPRMGYFPSCKEKTCKHPPRMKNGSIEIKGPGLKAGSVAIYSCDPGFGLLPTSAKKRACSKGDWIGPTPSCVLETLRKRHCPPPPPISNGHYIIKNQGMSETPLALPISEGEEERFERGTIISYLCKEGLSLRRLHGQDLYQCKSNGEWSPKYPPICIDPSADMLSDPLEEAMCPSPAPVPHADYERITGLLTSNGVLHGTVLEYSCQDRYRDTNTPCLPGRRTCHAGKWTGKEPSCAPFKFCVQPPTISHGFMLTPAENAYPVYASVEYGCQPGYRMKGSSTLKCVSTGCWTPNMLPQCVRAEFFESTWNGGSSGMSSGEESQLPAVALLVSVTVGCAVVALVTTVCLLIICRRKGGPSSPSQGPAHWSTTVTVTPECRPREPLNRRQDQDRMALIAFADGVQQVTLPSYEEALRDSIPASSHFPEYDNPLSSSGIISGNGSSGSMNGTYHLRPTVRHLGGRHGGGGRRSRAMVRHEESFQGRNQRHSSNVVNNNGGSSSTTGNGACNNAGRRRRTEHVDTLSDNVSHHSIHVWPCRQPSQTASLKSGGSIASMETVGGQSFSQVSGQSDNTVTTETSSTSNSSQTPSCRALAGSLASFDTSSIINTEGVPLLEENELETERSNSSETVDTVSATYSETSSKP